MGNHVAAVWADYPTVVSQLQSGTLRGLVTTSHARIETLPDVPTLGETGISKYEAEIFYGIVAPAKTPSDALNRFAQGPRHETQARPAGALSSRDVRRRIRRLPAAAGRRI